MKRVMWAIWEVASLVLVAILVVRAALTVGRHSPEMDLLFAIVLLGVILLVGQVRSK